ncbi:MFS transporter [Pectinatus haikarae]|uniref:MFS family permease n=1 Tax=Pectinatus haikarae TaxID=349096 RepID=A0ABT9Y9L6_9FIRM|nr:MFS transporter [Pectinatus haikarae]MDQ0204429.1 MFS family permease [Pectinatus haikarae]
MIIIFSIGFLMGIGVDLYVPSLPVIEKYFGTQQNLVQLGISLYMLGYGVAQIVFGICSDSVGRKKILQISSIIYTVSSFICIYAPHILVLDFFRFLQGVSVAGLAAVARAMIVDSFSGKKLMNATGWFGISWSMGPIIGPFIGSYLQHLLGWKADFFFFTCYGLGIYLFTTYKIPETNLNYTKMNFVSIEKNIKNVLFNPLFLSMTIVGGIGYSIIVIFNIVGPFLIQNIMGYGVIIYGYIALLLGAAYFMGCMFNRFAGKYFTVQKIMYWSTWTAIGISIIMLLMAFIVKNSLFMLLPCISAIFCCCGFIVPCSLVRTMSIFKSIAGTASSVFGSLSGIIVAVITIFAGELEMASSFYLALIYIVLFSIAMILIVLCEKKYFTEK